MTSASRIRRAAALAIGIACLTPAGVAVADDRVLSAGEAVARSCERELLSAGAPGAASTTWTAPARGLVTLTLAGGPGSDWDLAAFRAGEPQAAGASTAFGSDEQATLWVRRGDRLRIQGCRRSGGLDSVPLGIDLLRTAPPEPTGERISLESVPVSGPADVERLEQLGFDVTHDVSPTAATVALYSDTQRARLARAGFSALPLIPDLVAEDTADRRAEALASAARTSSSLPSGREQYRVYADYTSELKQLADDNPEIVRRVTLGRSFEGRPIQGVEIASDVEHDDDDGRPVYLNMGLHHAREWPSGELPMEFAIDLVEGHGTSARITGLLDEVRVVIVPVVNPDGFIASRSYGTSPADEDSNATLGFAVADFAAYKRKNCRPTDPAQASTPCAFRAFSGVDLNRNYGAYWGGSGSSSDRTSQAYRGTRPYSEPESEAVHDYTADIHPTVFITNHTFTEDGKWLRQPGFDDVIEVTPDEPAMKALGDAMAAATGWTSELGYETLGDITGATEDWNYFSQGTYGYTPEIRGHNFHANYADSVVEEYEGDSEHEGLGVREAFLLAGERAANEADHGVIEGTAPPGATLRLRKEFVTETSQDDVVVDDELDTRLTVSASGEYEWHVNPSGRPLFPNERWTMSCRGGGEERRVAIDRGERVTEDWGDACAASEPRGPTCAGERATIVGTGGADVLRGTAGPDVIVGRRGADRIRARGGADVICAGRGADVVRGGKGRDLIVGSRGRDVLRGGRGRDVLRGGRGDDRLVGGPGRDNCHGGRGRDTLRSC